MVLQPQFLVCLPTRRTITSDEKPLPEAEPGKKGPNQDQLPHVSEEAAATSEVTGEQGPDLDQGTPVEDILKRDPLAQDNAPKVIKNDNAKAQGHRKYHTSARNLAQEVITRATVDRSLDASTEGQSHIYGLPTLPIPAQARMKERYDPVIDQVTKLLMRHGKLSQARSHMAIILERLRTAPPPHYSPRFPLHPSAPPANHLPLNPALYLTLAIDSVAPLVRMRSQKGAAGGGMSLQIPIALNVRRRRRQAVQWILDASIKKLNSTGGRDMFARKFADELIAVVEGRSSVWEKRVTLHKMGTNARANLNWRPVGNRR